jgi:O-antigen/teichoic acid export membrane protein
LEAAETRSYRQIVKSTSLFGGVQVLNIIITIIRSKFIAILLGPAGMGIAGLYNSTTGLISGLTNFGLATSAVKSISSANATGNQLRIATVVIAFRRWVWVTGVLGGIACLVLSSWLSKLTFGNSNYTMAFIWLSVTLLFSQLTKGQYVILQGIRRLKDLAKASVTGSLVSLLITVPLYFWYRIDAIVPAIIISSVISFLFAWYYAKKVKIEHPKVSLVSTIEEGKQMLFMGFVISLSGLITLGASYIVRIYINNFGNLGDVGLYTSGFAIINTYIGLVFNALGTDYYPRLSEIAHSDKLSIQSINQQVEIALLILAPIVIVFIVFIQWAVILLYTSKFISIDTMIHWAVLGVLFKVISWALGFFLLAKGAGRLYLRITLLFEVFFLTINILGYRIGGLEGLGFSYMLGNILAAIQVYIVCKIRYSFSFSRASIYIFSIQLFLAVSSFIVVKIIVNSYSYIVGILIIILSIWYSYKEIDKRIGIKAFISSFVQSNNTMN